MSITLLSRPSAFAALGNPSIYRIQRKDFLVTSITNSSGLARLVITGDVTASFNVDDIIYVGVAGYNSRAEVVNRSTSGGDTVVTTTLPYIGSGSGYVNNFTLKPLHHIMVVFYKGDGTPFFNGLQFRFGSDETGLAVIDAQVLRYAINENLIGKNFNTDANEDDVRAVQFYIFYQEVWTTNSASAVDDSANKLVGVLSALQMPNSNVGLTAYVIGLASNPVPIFTTFSKFTAWKGYPFYFTIITTASSTAYNLYINGVLMDTSTFASYTAKIGKAVIPTDPGVYTLQLKTTGGTLLSEMAIEVREPDCINPVMLVGRDSTGNIVQWLFEAGQKLETVNEEGYKVTEMTCGVYGVSSDEFEALNQAFAPPSQIVDTYYEDMSTALGTQRHENKDVFILDANRTTKTQVTCSSFVAIRSTKSNGNYFEVTIRLPYNQDI